METKKIAIACFVGGVIGIAVALKFAPMFWWLGILTGFAVGYLCYDLKEIREKAPIAWEAAKRRSRYSLNWLKKPHPFLLGFLIISSIICVSISIYIYLDSLPYYFSKPPDFSDIICLLMLSLIFSPLPILVFSVLLINLTKLGSSSHKLGENCHWSNGGLGSKYIEPTYWNIYRLTLKGAWIVIYFSVRQMPGFLLTFLWKLFKLIHSHKRVLCGIDSAIGVAVIYVLLDAKAVTPGQHLMVVICGGIIGAVVGVLNYEIISKRLLHLALVKNDV